MSLTELHPISNSEYLKLCNFNPDFTVPDYNAKYLTEPYSNGCKKAGFKLIHKLLFYPELLSQYLKYLESTNINISEFIESSESEISLICLCVKFKLVESFRIITTISKQSFLNGIYNLNYIWNDYPHKYICNKLKLLNSHFITDNTVNIYLDNPVLYEYLKGLNTPIAIYKIKLESVFKDKYKEYLPSNIPNDIKFTDLNFYLDIYGFLRNVICKDCVYFNDYKIDCNWIDSHLESYKSYISEKESKHQKLESAIIEICDLVLEHIIQNYKNIDCNRVLDSDVLKIIIQCYKLL